MKKYPKINETPKAGITEQLYFELKLLQYLLRNNASLKEEHEDSTELADKLQLWVDLLEGMMQL